MHGLLNSSEPKTLSPGAALEHIKIYRSSVALSRTIFIIMLRQVQSTPVSAQVGTVGGLPSDRIVDQPQELPQILVVWKINFSIGFMPDILEFAIVIPAA